MPKTSSKIEKMSAIITFAEKSSKIFAIKKGTVFFINRVKLEKILSLLCLLGEFNEKYADAECENVTQWLKEKKLFNVEFLQEISDLSVKTFNKK